MGCHVVTTPEGYKKVECNTQVRYTYTPILPSGWFAQTVAPFSANTFDANLAKLDLTGTTVPLGSTSGNYVLSLYNGTATIGAHTFAWVKSGNALISADPVAVNAWVRQFPMATNFSVDSPLSFPAPANVTATVTMTSVYNSQTYGSSSQTLMTGPKTRMQ